MLATKLNTVFVTACVTGGLTLIASAQTSGTQEKSTTTTKEHTTTKHEATRNRTEGAEMKLAPADHRFFEEAAHGGMMEVQLAQTAQKQAENEQVKSLAQRIEQDHTNANNELKSLAERKGLTVPTTLDPKHQAMVDKFAKLNGAALDRAYTKQMVADHKKDIAAFEREANNGMDSDLKAFAAKTTPVLQEHLKLAEAAEHSISGKAANK